MGQKPADRVNNVRWIEGLCEIPIETGGYRPLLVFGRCKSRYGDDRRESFIFGIGISNRLQQRIAVGSTDADVGDYGVSWTPPKRIKCCIDRLRCNNKRARVFELEPQ